MTVHQGFFNSRLYSLVIILAVTSVFSSRVSANTPPVAIDDVMTLIRGQVTTTLVGGVTSVLENDTDPDGGNLSIDRVKNKPVNGLLTLNPDGSFTYAHGNSDSLSDHFVYRVCDDGDPVACVDARVNIFVLPSDDAICNIPGVNIPETGGVTNSINMPANGAIVDMNLALLVDHSWVGDLVATLSHDGTTVQLLDRPGLPGFDEFGCSEQNIDVILDDETLVTAEDMCVLGDNPVIYGTASPSGRLSNFRGQDIAGNWSLEIGDSFADASGGVLQMWCLIPIDGAFCSNPSIAIPDNDVTGVTDSIEVMLAGNLTDLAVMVQMDHSWVGDITAIISHNSTDVRLLDRPGVPAIDEFGCGNENIDAIFDDSESFIAEDTCSSTWPAIAGFFKPSEPLNALTNQELSGSWSLQVTDTSAIDTGTLQQWCLVPVVSPGSFTVNKDFSDDNTDSVSVSLNCTSGTVTNNPQLASEASPAVFEVEGFTTGTSCTATENAPPASYLVDETGCQDGDAINDSCTIVNTLNSGSFTVNKDFSDDSADSVTISLSCTTGAVTNNPQSASEASPAVFEIEGFTTGSTCTATEVAPPAIYVVDETGCQDGDVINDSCTIINTLNSGSFTVNKDFTDGNSSSVSISLSCTSGTVTNSPQFASEFSSAVFSVEGFDPGTTCTATEGNPPAGYLVDETDCQDSDAINGSCTIVNTPSNRPEIIFSDGFETQKASASDNN